MGRSGWACPQLRMTAVTTAASGRTGPTLEPEAIRPAASCRSSRLRQLVGTAQTGGERSRDGLPTEQCDHRLVARPRGTGLARSRLRVSGVESSPVGGYGLAPGGTTRCGGSGQLSHTAAGAPAGHRGEPGRRGELRGRWTAPAPVPWVGAYIYIDGDPLPAAVRALPRRGASRTRPGAEGGTVPLFRAWPRRRPGPWPFRRRAMRPRPRTLR